MVNLSEKWKSTSREYTEVAFSTKDDFRIGFYQQETEQGSFSSGGYIGATSCLFPSMQALGSVKTIADKGLVLLNEK